MKRNVVYVFMVLLLVSSFLTSAQQIFGSYSFRPFELVQLRGFKGFETYIIDSMRTDEYGRFILKYSERDRGMGEIMLAQDQPVSVVLENEDFIFSAEVPKNITKMDVAQGKENKALLRYALEQPRRDRALSAWNFLFKLYSTDNEYRLHLASIQAIENELLYIQEEEKVFFQELPKGSYVGWYLPLRKLFNGLSRVAQTDVDKIPDTRNALRNIDYSDSRLFSSGLLRESIDNHVWFIEHSCETLDSVFVQLNRSIDIILDQLEQDAQKYQIVTDYLFKLLEKRSLYTSAEYLALKVLGDQACTVSDDLMNKLEGYRQMKVGNKAPEIQMTPYTYYAQGLKASSLSEIPASFKVVVFAASWCSHCTEEIPKLGLYYPEWKKKGVEILLVSLDETTHDFVQFVGSLPFTSTTDLKKWEGQAVQDYHVFATPTMYLLDKELQIVLKPRSLEQLKAWIDWNLK